MFQFKRSVSIWATRFSCIIASAISLNCVASSPAKSEPDPNFQCPQSINADNQQRFQRLLGKPLTVHGWVGHMSGMPMVIILADGTHDGVGIECLPVAKNGELTEQFSNADHERLVEKLKPLKRYKWGEFVTATGKLCHLPTVLATHTAGEPFKARAAQLGHFYFSVDDLTIHQEAAKTSAYTSWRFECSSLGFFATRQYLLYSKYYKLDEYSCKNHIFTVQ